MSTTERTASIPLTPAISGAIISEAPAAPADDFPAAAETAITKALHAVDARISAIEVGETAIDVRWSSDLDASECAGRTLSLLEQGRVMESAILMEILLATDPENATILGNLGMVYSDAGYLERAIELLHAAVELNTAYADGFVALGVAYTRLDDLPNAEENLTHAIELDPTNPWAYRNLGVVYLRQDKHTDAVRVLTAATELSPDDDRAWYGLAQALELAGDTPRADDAYQQVISLNEYGDMAESARQARSKIASQTFREAPGDVRMDAVMYLVSALEKFQNMDTDQLKAIGFEIAMLGTKGININDPNSSYTIETLPGEFSGLNLVCHEYAAFKQFAPQMDIGIDLSKEYEAALEMFGMRFPGE